MMIVTSPTHGALNPDVQGLNPQLRTASQPSRPGPLLVNPWSLAVGTALRCELLKRGLHLILPPSDSKPGGPKTYGSFLRRASGPIMIA